jgi:class 3 adenylate cyclase
MRLQRRRFSEATDVRRFPHGHIDVVEMDDHVVGRMTYEPGWRWSADIQPIAGGTACQFHHLGFTVSGRLRVQMADGAELETGPNEVFEFPPGHDAWVVGDEPWVAIDFEAMRTFGKDFKPEADRTLASIVLTDIVDSTALAAAMGAARWRETIAVHNSRSSAAIDRQRGRLVKTTGDGVLASFDSPERAVRGAIGMRQVARDLDLRIRCGVHSGEVEVTADDLRGIAVHTAARIMAVAGPDEILVSATVMDLVDGSDLEFADAGMHELKGFRGTRQLFRLVEGVPPV